jgi:hypothetical protein
MAIALAMRPDECVDSASTRHALAKRALQHLGRFSSRRMHRHRQRRDAPEADRRGTPHFRIQQPENIGLGGIWFTQVSRAEHPMELHQPRVSRRPSTPLGDATRHVYSTLIMWHTWSKTSRPQNSSHVRAPHVSLSQDIPSWAMCFQSAPYLPTFSDLSLTSLLAPPPRIQIPISVKGALSPLLFRTP